MLFKNISINSIRAGMILASDAADDSGQIIVPKNTVLSFRFVARMQNAGIKNINVLIPDYIKAPSDEEDTKKSVSEKEEDPNREKRAAELKDFRRGLLSIANALADYCEKLMVNPKSEIEYTALVKMVNDISDKWGNTLHVLELLHASRDFEDPLYIHSACVTLVARIIGIKAQLKKEQIDELILCALLHDIGKTAVSEETLNKSGRLTADEIDELHSHVILGDRLLEQTSLPESIRSTVLYHHERFDGTGYPEGLVGTQIPFYARYVAVADVYCGMTSKRSYRESICAFDVVEAFERNGMQQYDPAALLPFLNCLAQSQIGSTVILNDGLSGQIIMLNERLTRPIIKVGSEFIDLMKRPELEIIKVV